MGVGIRLRSLNPLISLNVPEEIGGLPMWRGSKNLHPDYCLEEDVCIKKDSGEEYLGLVLEETLKTWKH